MSFQNVRHEALAVFVAGHVAGDRVGAVDGRGHLGEPLGAARREHWDRTRRGERFGELDTEA
jgi:hypothetical protein